MLLEIPDVFSPEEVRSMRSALERASWQDGTATAGGTARGVKRNLQIPPGSACHRELGQQVLDALGTNLPFVSAALPARIFPPNFNCYEGGGNYGAHVDGSMLQVPGTREMLRTDLSATLFLSEPDEYDGGELHVETQYGSHAVKAPAGHMVLYPATSVHRVAPVRRGRRLASFFWIQSLVRDSGSRELLFELDQSIQALTGELGSTHPQVTRLGGVYHNLMRRWAEP